MSSGTFLETEKKAKGIAAGKIRSLLHFFLAFSPPRGLAYAPKLWV